MVATKKTPRRGPVINATIFSAVAGASNYLVTSRVGDAVFVAALVGSSTYVTARRKREDPIVCQRRRMLDKRM